MKTILRNYVGNRGRNGLTRLEVLIIVVMIVLLAVMVLPALMQAKRMSMQIKCASNLKQVGLAFRIWEGDNEDHFPMSVLTNSAGAPLYLETTNMFRYFQIMSNELSNPNVLVCPADKRKPATNFTNDFNSTRISYFAGLDTDEVRPQMFLTGDRNLTSNGVPIPGGMAVLTTNSPLGWTAAIHQRQGNIAMADGSVQQYSEVGLNTAWQHSGRATNRLLLPDSAGK